MLLNPKIPKYIIKAANGVLFAPENTPTTPSATTLSFIFSTIQMKKKKLKYIFIKIILYFNSSFIEIYSYL